MSNLKHHAEVELKAAGLYDKDSNYGGLLPEAVMELIEVFAKQGHSGGSAMLVVDMFTKLAKFEPLVPLTGQDDEWMEVGDGVFQNKRCSHVFKQHDRFDGQAYDINGKVFKDLDGSCWTNADSRVPVIFPYTPKSEIVERSGEYKEEGAFK